MSTQIALNLLLGLLVLTQCSPDADAIKVPGYDEAFSNRAFAGYLKTDSDLRKMHYVFLQGNKGVNNSMPVTLWMNGGPGCTSKIGFVQQISAYYLNASQTYSPGDDLAFNPYAWTNISNLLFIDSPAGVGFSINNDPDYIYNDANTARDNLLALRDFYTKFPEYGNNTLLLAGQSYAAKYIPDLAIRILQANSKGGNPIPLKGILMGNPILSFSDLYINQVEWMMTHNFVDPQLMPYWEKSCKNDVDSAGCQYFYERYQDLVYRIDQYNIYGKCYGRKGPRQRALLAQLALKMSPFYKHAKEYTLKGPQTEENILNVDQPKQQDLKKKQSREFVLKDGIVVSNDAEEDNNLGAADSCSYDDGIESYLNSNAKAFNSVKSQKITVCSSQINSKYKPDLKGSITLLPSLLQKGLKVYLYTGDWDNVVPFTDTYMNLNKMGLQLQKSLVPWLIGDQHAGFIRNYSYGLVVYQVKGAGHEVPLYQRERAFRMFEKFVYA